MNQRRERTANGRRPGLRSVARAGYHYMVQPGTSRPEWIYRLAVRTQKMGRLAVETLFWLDRAGKLKRRPDLAFVTAEKWPLGKRVPRTEAWDVIPDLAVEVDISAPNIDRAGIYAALDVAEVWRFVGDQVIIEQLGDDRAYHPVEASAFLPIRTDEVRRWVVEEDSRSELDWARRLRAWVRAELVPRRPR